MKRVHYANNAGVPICGANGFKPEVTWRPTRVTCERCKRYPDWQEMMEDEPL